MYSSQSNLKLPIKRYYDQGPQLYQAILDYSSITMLPDLRVHEKSIKNFIQDANYNALFVFGPSGCGKRTVVKNHLNKNQIPYIERAEINIKNNQIYEMEDEDQVYRVYSIRQQIQDTLSQSTIKHVDVFDDFPFSSLQTSSQELARNLAFKKKFFAHISKAICKSIFILNTEIYNPFYILPKDLPSTIMSITFKPYTNAQVKAIIKDFCEVFPAFQFIRNRKDDLQQILQLSNGDARKAFLSMYQSYIVLGAKRDTDDSKKSKNGVDEKTAMKNLKRFPLFHLLGKYLYAKRYDVRTKTDRSFSRSELMLSDPPFYFDPSETFNRSLIPLNTFVQLLFQNYPSQFANMHDIVETTELFVHLNSIFPSFITNKKINSDLKGSQELYLLILTWGIIIKNKSASEVSKKFKKFRKSASLAVYRQINVKKQLMRKYFKNKPQISVIKFGFMARNLKTNKKYLASNLITQRNRFLWAIGQENARINQQQEDMMVERGIDENQIRRQIKEKKKQKQLQMQILQFDEGIDSEYSDIDSQDEMM